MRERQREAGETREREGLGRDDGERERERGGAETRERKGWGRDEREIFTITL